MTHTVPIVSNCASPPHKIDMYRQRSITFSLMAIKVYGTIHLTALSEGLLGEERC